MALSQTEAEALGRRRVILYARVSLDQYGNEVSTAQQLVEMREYADAQDWDVVAEFAEKNRSASRYARRIRPLFRRIFEMLDGGEADVILMWDSDRLLRMPVELEGLIDRADPRMQTRFPGQRHAVEVHSFQTGTVDLLTPGGRKHARDDVASAAKESDQLSLRISRDRRFRRRDGKPTLGLVYGWDGAETINETEAERVREMADRVLGGEAMSSVARDFTRRGIPRKRQGKVYRRDDNRTVGENVGWPTSQIRSCLTTPRNYGLIRMPDGTMKPGNFQGILPPDSYAQVLHVLADRGNRQTRPRRTTLLTGLVFCAECKHAMHRNSPGPTGRPVLACKKHAQDPPHQRRCGGNSIPAELVERFVTQWVWDEVDGPDLADLLVDRPEVDVAGITAELDRIEATLDRAAERTLVPPEHDGHLTVVDYKRMCRAAETRREELTDQLSQVTTHSVLGPYAGREGAVREKWQEPSTPVEWKRAIVAEVLEREGVRIEVTPGGRRNRADDQGDLLRIHVVGA